MAYWLFKTEPSTYSFDDLRKEKKTTWDGVTNALALKHLRSMKKGDLGFVYHTGTEKSIVGIAEIISNPFPDPKVKDPRIVVVDLRAKEPLASPVSLAEIKSRREFDDFALVRMGRLSVMPVSTAQWKNLLAMGA